MQSPRRKARSSPSFGSPQKKSKLPSKERPSEETATVDDKKVKQAAIVTPYDDQTPVSADSTNTTATTPTKASIGACKSPSKARRKLAFGNRSETIDIDDSVRLTYKLIRKATGSIGGNGSFGAIYGELTVGSMQKMVNLMKEHTGFNKASKFIDVGSGIGKPNLHVIQDPGVEFSYGIEMERSRWVLGMSSLQSVLTEARRNSSFGYRCIFEHGNIKQAKTFDPFTHVYMFSIGFPPSLWGYLAEMFNASVSPYLICFHPPRTIIERFEFDVELITQTPTSMHGSSEGHTGYLYKRKSTPKVATEGCSCDPLYRDAQELVKEGLDPIYNAVVTRVDKELNGGRSTRAKKVVLCIDPDSEKEQGQKAID